MGTGETAGTLCIICGRKLEIFEVIQYRLLIKEGNVPQRSRLHIFNYVVGALVKLFI